jgi:hypothetical protein
MAMASTTVRTLARHSATSAVHDAHQRAVEPAQVARAKSEHDAEGERQQRRGDAHQQGHARAVDHAAVDVAPEGVRAHDELVLQQLAVERHDFAAPPRAQVAAGGIEQRGIHRAEKRRRARHHDQQQQRAAAETHRPVTPQTPPGALALRDVGGFDRKRLRVHQ